MIRDLVIIGCGGFGREVADVVDAINRAEPTWNLLGFVDDSPSVENVKRVRQRGSAVLGTWDDITLGRLPSYVVGVGDGQIRAKLAARADDAGWIPATLTHPLAALGANLELGAGSIVCAHVAIGSDITIGRHVHLDRAAQVGHDSALGDFVTLHPAAVVSGNCNIEQGAELGTNCTLLPGVTVGTRALVAAAACVTTAVPSRSTVRGVPAK